MKKFLMIVMSFCALFALVGCSDEKTPTQGEQTPEEVKYVVTFDVEGELASTEVKEGEKIGKPLDPVKDGYTFLGWYNGETLYDFETSVTANITLIAKFEEVKEPTPEVKFVVTFDVDGAVTTTEVKEGEKIGKPLDPVKDGFKFLGWYVGEEEYDFEAIVTANVTLVAKFEEILNMSLEEEIKNWLTIKYSNITISGDIELVEEYKDTDAILYCDISHIKYLNYGGKFTAPVVDTKGYITYFVIIGDNQYEYEFPVVFKGYSNVYDATEEWLRNYIGKAISHDYELPLQCDEYGTTIQWAYDGELLTDGKISLLDKSLFDRELNFTCIISGNNMSKSKEILIYVSSLNDEEKVKFVAKELQDKYDALLIDSNIELEKTDELFETVIKWKSWAEHIVSSKGEYIAPLNSKEIKMQVQIRLNEALYLTDIKMQVKGIDAVTEWEKIEAFLNRINIKDVKNQSFYLYGCEEGYYQVRTRNYGYLPFYRNEELKVTEDILPDNSPLKANRMRTSTNYITIHNTGMAAPTATAYGLNEYIHTTDRVASWHFSVDDKEAYQELKLGEVGWHAGDGSHYYGEYWFNAGVWCIGGGNNNSVGLETCVYSGCDYNMVMRNTAKLVSKLLVTYNLTTSDIRQHYDFAGKDCPQVLRQSGRWAEQLELIELEYYARTELKGVQFEWKSLTPDIMDDLGRVSDDRPKSVVVVSYEVKVSYNGEEKTYTFSSSLNKL